ncbi:MAG: hypothetical protein NVSMB26_27500 [Beijerinckiaceae bacterium]
MGFLQIEKTLALTVLLAFPHWASAADHGWHCMAPKEVSNYELRGEQVLVRGILLREETGQLTNIPVIQANFTAENRGPKDVHVEMELTGSNDKGETVFAMSLGPAFGGIVSPNSSQPVEAAVFAAPGELDQATKICIRFTGDFE